jgi:polyribonucleotide nucleotidyltransferase
MPGVDGLLHVSEMANYRVANVRDELKEGEMVEVKVINIDPSGKVRLSRKALLKEGEGTSPKYPGAGEAHAAAGGGGGDDRPHRGDRDRGPRRDRDRGPRR